MGKFESKRPFVDTTQILCGTTGYIPARSLCAVIPMSGTVTGKVAIASQRVVFVSQVSLMMYVVVAE